MYTSVHSRFYVGNTLLCAVFYPYVHFFKDRPNVYDARAGRLSLKVM